jgi:hypothetical protein
LDAYENHNDYGFYEQRLCQSLSLRTIYWRRPSFSLPSLRGALGVAILIAAKSVFSKWFAHDPGDAWNQASFWRDSETLWTHTLAVTSNNDVAENNLGIIFLGRGQVDKAISRFQTAVDLRPEKCASP